MGILIPFLLLSFQVPSSICGTNDEFTDDNDYFQTPLCGDLPMFYDYICHCGDRTLSGVTDLREGGLYCCVPPAPPGQSHCHYEGPGVDDDQFRSDVNCSRGQIQHKRKPCHHQCWNSYRNSSHLYKTATLHCQEEEFCLPLQQMCSGVCQAEEELCNPDNLRCIEDPAYNIKSLGHNVAKDHHYCFLQVNNDAAYDYVTREDEAKVIGTNEPTVNYSRLIALKDKNDKGQEGFQCLNGFKWMADWCAGTGDVCHTDDTDVGTISLDNPELCRNHTFWTKKINMSCDVSYSGDLQSVGDRCTADYQHCVYPWYTNYNTNPSSDLRITCADRSDKAFPILKSCKEFNKKFLETYRKKWCTGVFLFGWLCDDGVLENWYDENQNNDDIRDPHGCEKSCTTAGADCLACEHKNFFHCNSTGVCIHKANRCDGHPHPSCGGDDESIDDCLDIYFKKRIVKRYATLICPSKMYPGIEKKVSNIILSSVL